MIPSQGGGCKGESCGISGCCDPNTQHCYTPTGYGGSYCESGPSNGRRLSDATAVKSNPYGDESLMVKSTRIGFINITSISGTSKKISIDKASRALHEMIIKAKVSEV